MSNTPATYSADGMQQSSSAAGLNAPQERSRMRNAWMCVLNSCKSVAEWARTRNACMCGLCSFNNVGERSRMRNACMCGLFSCNSVDEMWRQGGSLGAMDDEKVVISERALYGDCLRLISTEGTIVVTNRRFIVKKLFKIGPCNIQAEESSHMFANLQHVGVERGLYLEGAFVKWNIIRLALILAIILIAVGQVAVGAVLCALFGAYGLYNLGMISINWNTNFLVIDVANDNVIGTWQRGFHTSSRSYLTIRVPLHIKACFDVTKALLERHPLLPSPHAEV